MDAREAIRKQIEFYFSDSNILGDKFLRSQCCMHPEGFVALSTIASFKRIQSLSTEMEDVVEAVRGSKELILSEDEKMVRRVAPLPEEDVTIPRSIYAKKFAPDATIESISEFFAPHGTVQSVRLRRFKDKTFKGSVYVEFLSPEEAKSVLEKKLSVQEGVPLIMMTKAAHIQEMKDEMKKRNERRNAMKEKKGKRAEEEAEETFERILVPGLLLEVTSIPSKCSRDTLIEIFRQMGQVQFVDHELGKETAIVRFGSAEDCEKAKKMLESGEKDILFTKPGVRILEGDEEKKYWERVWDMQLQKKRSRSKRTYKRERSLKVKEPVEEDGDDDGGDGKEEEPETKKSKPSA
eukprot:TRINITY_DN2123_c0_g1_i1.p1 TRINITY_DN2123_c0_g1~~TRINITY_DN2123_c0_g1_i1.p1  ORF type:complete len:387 (-),score=137.48 TRINITY_DN2123_c0_g1_i1:204-1253(-)